MGASVQTSSLLEHFLCAHYVARHCARQFPVAQLLSCVQLFAAPWTAARQASLSSTIFQSLLTFIFIESMTSSSHLILCCPLLLLSVFPRIRVSNESALRTRWPKYWSFSFSISASKDYSGLTSFRVDWFDLLAEIPSAGHCGGSYIKRMGLRVEADRDGQQTRTQEPEQRDVQQRWGTGTVSWGGAGSGWSLERWVEVAGEAGLQRRSLSKGLEVEEDLGCLEKLGCLLERTGLSLCCPPSTVPSHPGGPAQELAQLWRLGHTEDKAQPLEFNSPTGILAPPTVLPWTKVHFHWVSWNQTSAIMRGPVFFPPYFISVNWNIVDLQCVVSDVQQSESGIYVPISAFYKDPFPIEAITEYWVEFPVLHSRSLLVNF